MNTEEPKKKATFEEAMNNVLGAALALGAQRGQEYADSWAKGNLSTAFLNHVQRTFIAKRGNVPWVFGKFEEDRITLLASLCDVKLSRLTGPFKEDTFVDLINYVAVLLQMLKEYDAIDFHNATK
jgi:hypothetical protein